MKRGKNKKNNEAYIKKNTKKGKKFRGGGGRKIYLNWKLKKFGKPRTKPWFRETMVSSKC